MLPTYINLHINKLILLTKIKNVYQNDRKSRISRNNMSLLYTILNFTVYHMKYLII